MYTPNIPKPRVLTVSQLNFYIKSVLENDPRLSTVFLTGEISNLTDHYRSGHIYLSLKDETSVIRAVMFSGNARALQFTPQNGMKVICHGRVAVYEPTGQYQLYIEGMQPDGVGALAVAYEQLKKSLAEKGLFDEVHKKPIPAFPQTVGVITSPTGAALQDIKNILYRRYPCVDVVLCPVLVQGDSAPEQLVRAVRQLDENGCCDVIIIGRGGGSIEDLWAFNNEQLAYAIYNCQTPVISAVGHETDFTICDFVSDLRAPTPSAAAELAVPDGTELKNELLSLYRLGKSEVVKRYQELNSAVVDDAMRHAALSPKSELDALESDLLLLGVQAQSLAESRFSVVNTDVKAAAAAAEALNPIATLARGYSIAERGGEVIYSKNQLREGDRFTLRLTDGAIDAIVAGD